MINLLCLLYCYGDRSQERLGQRFTNNASGLSPHTISGIISTMTNPFRSKPQKVSKTAGKKKFLPRLTIFFFDRPVMTLLLWLVVIIFGLLSYTTFLKREGFPSVNIPYAVVDGTYYVNDSAKVDAQLAKPISDLALQQADVSSVQTQSNSNFFTASIQYKDGTDAKAAVAQLEKSIQTSGRIPPSAHLQYNVPYFGATGGDTQQIDVAISLYSTRGAATAELATKAQQVTQWLNDQHIPDVKSVFVKDPFEQITDPTTGQAVTVQHTFDRYGERADGVTSFHNSVIIGIAADKGADVIKLDDHVRVALTMLEQQSQFSGYQARVSASFAPSIKDNLNELQRVLLEGLLAILIVGSLVIAIRASFITVVSMVTVLLTTLGFLYLIGYTLNVITLFALILGLALIVDDTIIMVEAIDAARQRIKDRRQIVLEATRKISRAMVAATATAALSFAPLIFVGGILGSFIRAIPVTLISALIISLLVALIFIPFFSRFVLLGKKQMGKKGAKEVAAGFEAKVAATIARPMLWARKSRIKLVLVIVTAVLVGLGFIGAGLAISQKVVFNIFPPTKDTNGVALNLHFPPQTTIDQAQNIAAQADSVAAQVIGPNFEQSSYYDTGSTDSAMVQIQLTPYSKRTITSPQIVQALQQRFDTGFHAAQVTASQIDIGPPASAFVIQVDAGNRPAAFAAASDLAHHLSTAQLKRPSGKVAHFKNITVSNSSQYLRTAGRSIITVSADFDGNDTTTLVTLAQSNIKNEFTASKLQSYGLSSDAIQFDLGQETQNQNSFKTLALAFPILLCVMFVLLAIQFRSLLQPLLIFMAIPFSIFGVMLGLDLTNNAISFFTMLGFFALVGLSIKNTILLTDYANQARREGMAPIDAAVEALEERFRPLFATSMTAVVSLIPLALSSPFWEGLAVVLIFGLLSSTFLVVTVFPYYYLAAEFLRLRVSAKDFFSWLIPTVIATASIGIIADNVLVGLLAIPACILVGVLYKLYFRESRFA